MPKPFKTIEEQCDLLKKRNLIISNEERAKHYLITCNYYNLINCFGKFFLDNQNVFLPGTDFEEILALYHFDREIKMAFLNSIIEVERKLSTLVSYYFSLQYPYSYSYLHTSNFDPSDILKVSRNLSSFSKKISSLEKKSEPSIIHYINHHGEVPLWVLINYFEFGEICSFIEILENRVTNNIARELSKNLALNTSNPNAKYSKEELITAIHIIRMFRNTLAHNNKLIEYKSRSNFKFNNALWTSSKNSRSPRNDVYSIFVSLQVFLSPQQYAILNNTIRKRIKTLSKKINTVSINEIICKLGFPNDWHLNSVKLSQ